MERHHSPGGSGFFSVSWGIVTRLIGGEGI